MQFQIIGISARRTGISKDGKNYDGTTLHTIFSDPSVQGNAVKEIYVNHSTHNVPTVGINDVIDVQYNFKGFIYSISLVEKAKRTQGQ